MQYLISKIIEIYLIWCYEIIEDITKAQMSPASLSAQAARGLFRWRGRAALLRCASSFPQSANVVRFAGALVAGSISEFQWES